METVTIAKTEYESLKTNCSVLEQHVKILLEQIRLSRHKRFGFSSEKSAYEQLSLFNEAEAVSEAGASGPELIEVEKHYRKARRALGGRLPENLPVEIIDYELPENERDCPECGGPMHAMGHDSRRELVIVPAQVKIVEHRRAAYSCRHCEKHNDHIPWPKRGCRSR